MLVVDASAAAEILIGGRLERDVASNMAGAARFLVPEHFEVEVLAAIRRAEARGDLDDLAAHRAVGHLRTARLLRRPIRPLTETIWKLRDRLTVHDAAYVALAMTSRATLLTLDRGQATVARSLGIPVAPAA